MFNGGAIPANGAVQNLQLTPALDLSETPPEMVQLRAYVLDDIEVSIKRGTSDVRFKGQNFLAFVDTFTDERDPDGHTTEFVVLKRDHPALDFTNPRAFAIAQSRIALSGYRYILFDLALASKDAKEIERQLGIVTFVAAGGI